FKLHDTYCLDYPYYGAHGPGCPDDPSRVVPHSPLPLPAKVSWWPWGLFALRDANLFTDFPTSARLELQFFKKECDALATCKAIGADVQGVVAITPAIMISVLKGSGNVPVPAYGEAGTPAHLESLIHKYQLGSRSQPGAGRKGFTAALAQQVMMRLHGLPLAKLNPLLDAAIKYLHTKDIQVYLTDAEAEALLSKAGFDATTAHGAGDAVTPVDSNITGSKANQFVTVKYADTVTLDASGTATHRLAITYVFRAADPK